MSKRPIIAFPNELKLFYEQKMFFPTVFWELESNVAFGSLHHKSGVASKMERENDSFKAVSQSVFCVGMLEAARASEAFVHKKKVHIFRIVNPQVWNIRWAVNHRSGKSEAARE